MNLNPILLIMVINDNDSGAEYQKEKTHRTHQLSLPTVSQVIGRASSFDNRNSEAMHNQVDEDDNGWDNPACTNTSHNPVPVTSHRAIEPLSSYRKTQPKYDYNNKVNCKKFQRLVRSL